MGRTPVTGGAKSPRWRAKQKENVFTYKFKLDVQDGDIDFDAAARAYDVTEGIARGSLIGLVCAVHLSGFRLFSKAAETRRFVNRSRYPEAAFAKALRAHTEIENAAVTVQSIENVFTTPPRRSVIYRISGIPPGGIIVKRRNARRAALGGGAALLLVVGGYFGLQEEPPTPQGAMWRGLTVAPENRCSDYSKRHYPYRQSVELGIINRMGGRIYGPYTGRTFSDRSETDIEHIVATSEAHDSGMCAMDAATKRRFASDLDNLTLASSGVNRHQKSGEGRGRVAARAQLVLVREPGRVREAQVLPVRGLA